MEFHTRENSPLYNNLLTLSDHLHVLILCGTYVTVSPVYVFTLTTMQLQQLTWNNKYNSADRWIKP